MRHEEIPVVILGGRDPRPATLPRGGEDQHPLTGYKGAEIRIEGRPIIEHLVECLHASGCFGPVFIAGPSRAYGRPRREFRLVETDGSVGGNIRTSMEVVRREHPGRPVAFISCDILPDATTLRRAFEDYRRDAPLDIWFPLIRVPGDRSGLGASTWKPVYRVVLEAGRPPVDVLGGHLAIVAPGALRLDFLYRLFDLAYRTRNQAIDRRRGVIVRGLLGVLLRADLRRIAALRMPDVTWRTLRAGGSAARELREGTITPERLERAVDAMLVERPRGSGNGTRVRIPVLHDLALALDIDTEEEARAAGGSLPGA